jgi:hypothetical protein
VVGVPEEEKAGSLGVRSETTQLGRCALDPHVLLGVVERAMRHHDPVLGLCAHWQVLQTASDVILELRSRPCERLASQHPGAPAADPSGGDEVMIPGYAQNIPIRDEADALVGVGPVAHEVAETQDPVDVKVVQQPKRGPQGAQVGVDVS